MTVPWLVTCEDVRPDEPVAFPRLNGALPRPLRPLAARLVGWQRQRRTRHLLMRCSDRVLADIGIARDDIPLIAKGLEPRA